MCCSDARGQDGAIESLGQCIDFNSSQQVVMTPENEALWAELPGDSKVDLHRKVTFYDLTNGMDVLFRG